MAAIINLRIAYDKRRPYPSGLSRVGFMEHESSFASGYDPGRFFDEMFAEAGRVRPHYERLLEELGRLSRDAF